MEIEMHISIKEGACRQIDGVGMCSLSTRQTTSPYVQTACTAQAVNLVCPGGLQLNDLKLVCYTLLGELDTKWSGQNFCSCSIII